MSERRPKERVASFDLEVLTAHQLITYEYIQAGQPISLAQHLILSDIDSCYQALRSQNLSFRVMDIIRLYALRMIEQHCS